MKTLAPDVSATIARNSALADTNARTTGTVKTMTTDELIRNLRDKAEVEGKTSLGNLLNLAADRLEELDERVAIMMEGNNIEE